MHRKIMTIVYLAFGGGVLFSLVPHWAAAVFSTVLIIGSVAAAYGARSKHKYISFMQSHTTFLIRTFWLGSGLAAVTMLTGGGLLVAMIDHTPLDPCIQNLASLADPSALANMSGLEQIFGPCYGPYMQANMSAFIICGIIAAGPPLLYVLIRLMRGVRALQKNQDIPAPMAWL
jgi:uncharacterized membrane protein